MDMDASSEVCGLAQLPSLLPCKMSITQPGAPDIMQIILGICGYNGVASIGSHFMVVVVVVIFQWEWWFNP